ncbi:hypothetical protein GCM10023193_45710 [Planotetraspora kaengkrachanensis]|uniref:Uncharacterized protein n=1 Tax=Planotetraspora kaengkrachanensis TaxID=575193 RepID=A0A8J3PZV8_9ACTN|nr:hypothetical protein Pka01_74010 [Planotetraspora kaengkrachanensis]
MAAHLANCRDCASYVSQIDTTRELLKRHSGRGGVQNDLADDAMPVAEESPATGAEALRSALLTRAELLDPANADEPELFYPDLYPGEDRIDGWVDSPNQWGGGAQILGPEEVDETGEVYDLLDKALGELPEPLGELLALVDLQGYALAGSAQALGLDELSATAALARVRGRLDEYLHGAESTAQGVPR